MRFFVDPWNPTYGTAAEDTADGGPTPRSSAELDADVEMPVDEWHPITAPSWVKSPEVVLFVDGVRRVDASLWIGSEERPGIAASYAAGVVRCDAARGTAQVVSRSIERSLISAAADIEDLETRLARYVAHHIDRDGQADLQNGLQRQMQALEAKVSIEARSTFDDELLFVDGQLDGGRRHLPNALGYIKTQRTSYLPARLSEVVAGLAVGQRTPVFQISTVFRRLTWYLRLPSPTGAAWSGIVRIECSGDLPPSVAVELADVSAATLPRFASVSYKDPRAPQNLVPIAGLERQLRHMLGDGRLLHRALMGAASAAADLTGGAV